MMQRRENELDALFKRKLEDLDMGRQEHLWQGIADQLSKNKRSNRLIGFAWFSGILLSFTLLGLGITTAYKYNLEKNSQSIQKLNPSQEIAQANKDQLSDNAELSGNTEYGHSSTVEASSLNHKSNDTKVKNESNKTEVKENYNINSIVNQEDKSKKLNTNQKLSSHSNLVEKSNSTSITTYNKHTNTPNQLNETNSTSIEKGNQEPFTNSQNSSVTRVEVSNTALSEVNSNSQHFSNTKVDEYSFLTSGNKIELYSKYNKVSSNKLKLPINDYCLAKNLTPLHHFDIDLYYSPEIATRTISAKSVASLAYAQKRAGSETFSGASSFGLRLSYVTKNGLAFRTGVNIGSISEKFGFFDGKETLTKIIYDQFNKPIDTIIVSVDKIVNQKNVYKFIDIPIVIGYEMDISDFVFSFNTGIGLNLRTNYYGSIYAQNGMDRIGFNHISSENGNNRPYFKRNIGTSLIASFGLNYKLNGRFLLLAEPSLRYYLNSLTSEEYPLEQRYLQLGIAVGLRYRFY